MRAHHAGAAQARDVQTETGGEFCGWAGRTGSWWQEFAGTLGKVPAVDTDA